MSSFADKFKKALTQREFEATETLVMKVASYETEGADKGKHRIKGVALTGPDKDQEISLAVSRSAHPKAPDILSFAGKKGGNAPLLKTPIGGLISIDRPKKVDEKSYEAGWIQLVAKDPEKNPVLLGLSARIAPVVERDGKPRVNEQGVPHYSVGVLRPEDEVQVGTVADFRAKVAELLDGEPVALGGSHAVVISVVSPEYPQDGIVKRAIISRPRVKDAEGHYSDGAIAPAVDEAIKEVGGEKTLAGVLENGAKVGLTRFSFLPFIGKSAEKLAGDLDKGGNGRSVTLTEMGSFKRAESGSGFEFTGSGNYGYRKLNFTLANAAEEGKPNFWVVARAVPADNIQPVLLTQLASPLLSVEDISEHRKLVREAEKKEAAEKGKEQKSDKAPKEDPAPEAHVGQVEPPVDPMDFAAYDSSTIDELIEKAGDTPAGP